MTDAERLRIAVEALRQLKEHAWAPGLHRDCCDWIGMLTANVLDQVEEIAEPPVFPPEEIIEMDADGTVHARPLGHAFWKGRSKHDRCRVLVTDDTCCGRPASEH